MRAGAQINHCRSDKSTAAVGEGGKGMEGEERISHCLHGVKLDK